MRERKKYGFIYPIHFWFFGLIYLKTNVKYVFTIQLKRRDVFALSPYLFEGL